MAHPVPERGRHPPRQFPARWARALGCGLGLAALLVAGSAAAASPGFVLIVRSSALKPYKAVEEAFAESVGRPTQTLSLSDGDGPDKVEEAIGSGAALVFVVGEEAARTVSDLKVPVPIMYALVPNLARAGLDDAIAGISMYASSASQASAIHAALPRARRVGLLYNPATSLALVAQCEAAARADGLVVVAREVASREQVAGVARELFNQVDALWLIPDTTVISAETFKFLVQTSLETKVPLIGFSEGMTRAGALLSIEAQHQAMGKKAADLARRILGGEPARQESPDGSITINLKSAQLLGVTIPGPVKERATKAYE